MLRNYLKVAFRNVIRHKGYSFINITGLAIGMACCIFLFMWVQDELGFDRFHKNAKNLYRLEQDQKSPEGKFHVTVTPYPFEYRFFDEDFDQMYQADENIGAIIRLAAVLALIIACLGLFGLASFMVEQRTKEVGVRKVLGASISGITMMLSKEFVKWVIAANIIAAPVLYYLANKWLQDYPYRVAVGWWVFAVALVVTLFIALLTVIYQSLRAARANPVESLRYE